MSPVPLKPSNFPATANPKLSPAPARTDTPAKSNTSSHKSKKAQSPPLLLPKTECARCKFAKRRNDLSIPEGLKPCDSTDALDCCGPRRERRFHLRQWQNC